MAAGKEKIRGKKKLKRIIFCFLFALSIPAAALFWKAYDQLKWEAAFQNTKLAQDLSSRVNSGLKDRLRLEEERAFTDYRFLVVSGDQSQNYLQTSPLSVYPVPKRLPGLIGYFQIDSRGVFSTPLLPEEPSLALQYGVSSLELNRREALAGELFNILKDNKLVAFAAGDSLEDERKKDLSRARFTGESEGAEESVSSAFDSPEPYYFSSSTPSSPSSAPMTEAEDDVDNAWSAGGDSASSVSLSIKEELVEEQIALVRKVQAPKPSIQKQKKSAVDGFKDLKQRERALPAQTKEALGKLKDLPLEQNIVLEKLAEKSPKTKAKVELQRSKRREQSLVAEISEQRLAEGKIEEKVDVALFESQISPFELSMLDSGHLILYRQVWRDGKQYYQGSILQRDAFLEELVITPYLESSISLASRMIIAYQENIINAISGAGSKTYLSSRGELGGVLLHETPLIQPLEEFTLLFSSTDLSSPKQASTLIYTALTLLVVMILGGWAFYRSGLKQITVASQQQDFVSAVSHELKTPLTSIRMYGEMLMAGWADEEKKQQYYQYITDESERLSRLITNILQFAKMNRGELQVETSETTVGELIDLVRSRILGTCETAGFNISVPTDSPLLDKRVSADKDAFIQVMINLVDNAIKFSQHAESKKIEIELQSKGSKVIISLRDHGPGVPKKQLKKIYEIFYRIENEMTRSTKGTGIGLALVHRLVAEMGAFIEVKNADPGLRFEISFVVLESSK